MHTAVARALILVGNTSLYSNHGTGPAPREKRSVYAGMVMSATVRCGSSCFSAPPNSGAGKSLQMAARVSHVTHGNPLVAEGVGTAQNDATASPGVSALDSASAARDAAMPPNDNNRSGLRPYLSVAASATSPPRRFGTPTAYVNTPGSSTPASRNTEDA